MSHRISFSMNPRMMGPEGMGHRIGEDGWSVCSYELTDEGLVVMFDQLLALMIAAGNAHRETTGLSGSFVLRGPGA